ncbi:hypothetical protein BZA70DRAFT_112130 [Myxozyma melibiosi]|uniref:DUF1279 domain-containing protein n=1 Tax=Myxozyma melibiosi TaxID=54550 RepID=A0ABR1FA29_9ASCO
MSSALAIRRLVYRPSQLQCQSARILPQIMRCNRRSQPLLSSSFSSSAAAKSSLPAAPFSAVLGARSSRALFRLVSMSRNLLSRPLGGPTGENAALQRAGRVRFNSTKAPEAAKKQAPPPAAKKESRLKQLTKKYGWPIVWIYLGLSVLDYPVCFLVVHMLGQEKIGELEDTVVEFLEPVTSKIRDALVKAGLAKEKAQDIVTPLPGSDAAAKAHKASIWTELVIAYGIHKSLLVFRIPLAAAITPPIVKWGSKHFPRLFKAGPRFGVKADDKHRFGSGLM